MRKYSCDARRTGLKLAISAFRHYRRQIDALRPLRSVRERCAHHKRGERMCFEWRCVLLINCMHAFQACVTDLRHSERRITRSFLRDGRSHQSTNYASHTLIPTYTTTKLVTGTCNVVCLSQTSHNNFFASAALALALSLLPRLDLVAVAAGIALSSPSICSHTTRWLGGSMSESLFGA